MNILVTTFGTSWQIVPELFGFTNPDDYNFFFGNIEAENLRAKQNIKPIDEIWIITTEKNDSVVAKLKKWSQSINIHVKQIECIGVSEFHSEREILSMRSCIYAAVAAACKYINCGKLYLSVAGGRKTMSADMQDAGYLFGCDAMFHIIDIFPNEDLRKQFNNEELISHFKKYAHCFLPVIINKKIRANYILEYSKIENPTITFNSENKCAFNDGGKFANDIQNLKNKSSQLYANYSASLVDYKNERQIFYKLNFLPPQQIHALKNKIIAQNKYDKENDIALLKKLPKADLHSHLGGVLSAGEIIDTALCTLSSLKTHNSIYDNFNLEIKKLIAIKDIAKLEKEKQKLFELKKSKFKEFYPQLLYFISAFKDDVSLFDTLIFGEYKNPDKFYNIGLEAYQRLGDFQGSSLLQTEAALRKAVELYVKKLYDDNIRYVEIRCSPYKYTKMGLTAEKVTDIIIKTMDNYKADITYRLIMIVDRGASSGEIKNSIKEIIKLHNQFGDKIAGIDLAGTENGNPPKQLREAFIPLLEKCLNITIHAGETESVDSIWQAVYHLSAERVGHGLRLNDKKELIKSFLNKNIGIEMCPSSNDQIVGFSKNNTTTYPLKNYMQQKLKVTVNTDDCGISRTFLSGEFYKAAELSLHNAAELSLHNANEGLRLWDCFILIRNSLSSAFVPKDIKAKLMQQFEDEIFKLCEQGIIL